MQVVATLSLKGGVGKTTVALGLAGAAQRHGVSTLVVDLDPQANATTALDPEPTTATVADVLDDPRPAVLRRAIAASGWGEGLDVLVGAEQTERHNHPDPGIKQLHRLDRALQRLAVELRPEDGDDAHQSNRAPSNRAQPDRAKAVAAAGTGNGTAAAGTADPDHTDADTDTAGAVIGADGEPYRLVIVDCPPSLGQLTRSALSAADRAILVADPTMFSVSGVQRAFDAVQTERERSNPRLQPLGVLVNRVRPRNSEHEFRIGELRELFGPLVFGSVLPDRSAVQQAQGACLPIQSWDTPGAREVSAVFTSLLGRVLRSGRARASHTD